MVFVSISETVEPCNKLDPFYLEAKKAIEITKRFISDRGLVCYGGTALDYSMRLRGSKIYDDSKLDLPDLDFYSLDPVKDASDLSDILFENGFSEARMIGAVHVGTFRVDAGFNHFIADVSYCPILQELRTLKYESFLVVDPVYQRLDVHSSLSFPYDNAPREVIFDRWKKDVERFNMFNEVYPLDSGDDDGDKNNSESKVEKEYSLELGFVYTGSIGYDIFMDRATLGDGIKTKTEVIEICSKSPEEDIQENDLVLVAEYESYFNLLPKMYFVKDKKEDRKMIIYSTEHKLLSREIKEISGKKYRIACTNYTSKIILGWTLVLDRSWPWLPDHASNGDKEKKKGISMYNALLRISRLSIETYGYENIDHNSLMKMDDIMSNIEKRKKSEDFILPQNYKSKTKNRLEELFDYRKNILLRVRGDRIEN